MPSASGIEYIRRVAGPAGTDASLLKRFVRQRDVLDHRVRDLLAAMDRGKLLEASQRLLRAELDLASNAGGRRNAYAAQIERMSSIESVVRERVRAGALPRVAELEIESIKLEAEARAQQER